MSHVYCLIVLCSSCLRAGLWVVASVHPAFALAFLRQAASIMPAGRL